MTVVMIKMAITIRFQVWPRSVGSTGGGGVGGGGGIVEQVDVYLS